ncbi:hypothetical protein FBY34_8538 [Streptomyces sp. SLBN-115]|nr:hypothetical protein FBY34_8538 [Streptomyces sp. SLBN-115]
MRNGELFDASPTALNEVARLLTPAGLARSAVRAGLSAAQCSHN